MSGAGTGRVLMIEPMTSAVTVLQAAAGLGWSTAAATWDAGDRRMPDHVRAGVDTLIVIDPNDEQALWTAVLAEHRIAPFTAVLPGIEFYVATAARLADRLGLPGLPVDRVDALRDKVLMRSVLAEAGLPGPATACIDEAGDLAGAAAHVGFPAVFKPRDSAGSIHVSRVDDVAQLDSAYAAMVADPRPDDVGRPIGSRAVLEGYLEGPEVSADGYIGPDGAVVLSVTHKVLSEEPHFVEIGHSVAGHADPFDAAELRARILNYTDRVCRALGATAGPFHCELRLPGGEPTLVEIGARLPGGRIVALIEWTTGVQLPVLALTAAAGLPLRSLGGFGRPDTPFAGVHNFTAPHLDVVRAVIGVEWLRSQDWVREVTIDVEPGDSVPEFGDFRCRLGQALFVADSRDELQQRRLQVARAVRFG